jgi:hypothetical protein
VPLDSSDSQPCPTSQSEDVLAYLDGAASPELANHIADCLECRQAAQYLAETQARLRQRLYRFDCPSPLELGEYNLDLVPEARRTAIAGHSLECRECGAELSTLRAFLAADPPAVATFAERARRVVARLLTSPGAPGALAPGLRAFDAAAPTIYRVEDVSISLIQGPGTGELTGIVSRDVTGPETVVGADVYLVDADGARRVGTIGNAGEFGVAALPSGSYELELRLEDRVVVIPGVHFRQT